MDVDKVLFIEKLSTVGAFETLEQLGLGRWVPYNKLKTVEDYLYAGAPVIPMTRDELGFYVDYHDRQDRLGRSCTGTLMYVASVYPLLLTFDRELTQYFDPNNNGYRWRFSFGVLKVFVPARHEEAI